MTDASDDGGPAFPVEEKGEDGTFFDITYGLSIRDWFAGQMLPRIGMGWPNDENKTLLARRCYEMADAMLAERSK